MLWPDSKEYQSTSEGLRHSLGETARRLITQVDHDTGHSVLLQYKGPDVHGSYGHISYATNDEPHTIRIIPEALPFLDYLISHECAHALRFFAVPESERLLGYIDQRHRERAARALIPAIRTRWKERSAPHEKLASIYHQGIIGQAINFPADLRIETFLLTQYPDLRPLQQACLRANIAELAWGLHPEVQDITPPFAFRVQNSLNSAYSTFIARLLDDPGLAKPFRQAGLGLIGEQLTDPIWQTRFADYRQDRRDTDEWAKRFGIARWFMWASYRP